MQFLHSIRAAVIKDQRAKRDDGRFQNATMEYMTKAQNGNYI
jgi:hypothetical protein